MHMYSILAYIMYFGEYINVNVIVGTYNINIPACKNQDNKDAEEEEDHGGRSGRCGGSFLRSRRSLMPIARSD